MEKKWSYWGYAMDPNTKEHSKKGAVESSREPAGYGDDLKRRVEELHDQLHNGIKYDEGLNVYVLCWTEKQIAEARREADEFLEKLKWAQESP